MEDDDNYHPGCRNVRQCCLQLSCSWPTLNSAFLFENKYFFMHFCQAAKRELFKTDDIPTYYVVTVLSPVPLMHAHKSAERSEKSLRMLTNLLTYIFNSLVWMQMLNPFLRHQKLRFLIRTHWCGKCLNLHCFLLLLNT